MAYRGDDLDLRTPQTWSASSAELSSPPEPYTNGSRARGVGYNRASPILVDDIVLACSNHAFDVAVAHRAGEVRLEHLLHAMTRVEGASNALEARGIRVPGLRRESATIIAGEIPIGLGGAQIRPHRSDEFEQALRTASTIAYRRNAPANVDDLLDAMLDMPSDSPGIALLARHGGRIARDRLPQREAQREREAGRERDLMRDRDRDMVRPRERELQPLPPLSRSTAFQTEPRASEQRKSQAEYYVAEPARPSSRTDLIGTQVDGIQNARIDQLENALRSLATDLASDRAAQRDDASRLHGGIHDRMKSLEQTVLAANASDSIGGSDMMLDRLASVERTFEQRLNELSRPWGVLSDRLQGLEQTILDTRGAKNGDVSAVADRLERSLSERMKGLERALDGGLNRSIDFGPISNRLDIIEEAVLSPAANSDTEKLTEKLVERLRALEDTITNQRALASQANQALSGDVKQLASTIAGQSANSERVQSFVAERFQTLTLGFERQRDDVTGPVIERINALGQLLENRITTPLNDRMAGLAQSLDVRLQSVSGLMDRQRTEGTLPVLERVTALQSAVDTTTAQLQRSVVTLAERVETVEANLRNAIDQVAQAFATQAAQVAETQAAHTAELKEVHEALIKLNTNQHTLAGSIDQWRLDGVGDISVIANRLQGIEASAGKPIQMIEALTTSVDNINRLTVERYHRRNRFWYWLFGTDDWVTASWPSQVANVEAERNALRGSVPTTPAPTASQSGLPKSLQR